MNKGSKAMYLEGVRCQILYCTMNKGSNAIHVKGVKSSSKYTIRTVKLSMSEVSKEAQYTL